MSDMKPMKVTQTNSGTADATTYITSGIALPDHSKAAWQVLIINRGSAELVAKLGPSTGPNASNVTDGFPALFVPAGHVHIFTRSQTDTHIYLYCATSTTFAIESGSGE